MSDEATPADWYLDPVGSHHLRFFDGVRWTEYVSAPGNTEPRSWDTDPLVINPAPPNSLTRFTREVLARPPASAAGAAPAGSPSPQAALPSAELAAKRIVRNVTTARPGAPHHRNGAASPPSLPTTPPSSPIPRPAAPLPQSSPAPSPPAQAPAPQAPPAQASVPPSPTAPSPPAPAQSPPPLSPSPLSPSPQVPLVPSASDSVAPVPAAPAATGAISSAEAARHLPVPGAQTSRPAEPRTDPDGWLESAVRSPEFWIRAAVVALAVFAFLIFVVVGLRALFSGDDGVERPETPTDLTSFPNPVERPLVAALPADLDCGRSPVAGPAVEAAVTCAGSIPISEVKLTSFGTTMGLDAYINSLDVVETAGGVTGSCAADGPADVHWQAVASERTGRLLCASTNGGAVLVWTETGRLEVGEARGTSVTELFRWWSAQVLGAEATELAPFPGPLEETLLSAIVPDGLGGNCSRYADVQPSVEASISCQGESPSRLFVDSITVGVSLDEYFASFRLPPIDSGSCSLGVAGNTVYLIDDIERGRVACIRRDGRTFIQWYDAPARVSGQAVFVDEGLADAYQWWLDNIAPGAVELVDFDEEAQAIVALGPPDVGENCGSRAVGPRADWISEVQCFPADENVESVTFLLFDDGAEAQAEYFVRIGEGAMELNTGDCFAGETGEQPVTDETADAGFDGRLGCQLRGGVAEVLRLDPDNAVLIRVVGANGDLSAVTDWSIR